MLANRYILQETIGEGSFGTIMKAFHERTGEPVAIKIEKKNDSANLLKHETNIYKYIGKKAGIPAIKWFGQEEDKFYYLVLPFYEKSLTSLKNKLHMKEIYKIGQNILDILKFIHSRNIIHRDINPNNIMLDATNHIHIIDFGFAKTFMKTPTEHLSINTKKKEHIIGTLNFVSIHVHNGYEPSRRDECESIAYIMLFLFKSAIDSLWSYSYPNETVKNIKLQQFMNYPKNIGEFIKYCNNLCFEENPDYEFLNTLFKS